MASRYDLICNVNGGSEHKIWRIKVRVIRLWRSSYFKDNNNKPMIELVVLDEQGGRIQCTVKSIHVYLFENSINEGNVYMLENLSVALNSGKYKPTMHEFRMFFKRETRVTLVEDSSIPLYGFSFVPFVEILNETKDDRRLVDVLGVVTGKGNLIEFKKEGKSCNYVVIELENIEYSIQLRVVDETDSASFILFDKEASNFLKIPAYELRTSYIAKGGDKNRHPEEIDSFKDKKFLFKVQVKIQDMESIVPCVISISRLCFEDNIIASFEKKYQIEEVALIQDNSELLSQFTESSDLLKILQVPFYRLEKTASNMDSSVIKVLDVDLAEYCGNASFDTPSKCKGEMHSEQTIVRVAVHGDEQSAKKLRKLSRKRRISLILFYC
ncbi:Nucleic acid-binding, OB-fold [Sesbania bispinosa]|nr:Nucleic acid-binding, OB-fold [Sesbania bispinosa]